MAEKSENKLTISERFLSNVQMQYVAEVGKNQFSDYEKMLLQHLFIKVDFTLKELESKRDNNKYKVSYTWDNVNMAKLSLDAVNRVQLGLDALIQNHIHPIAFFNGKTQKYDMDLRIGYTGKMYYKSKLSKHEIKDIRIEIVYGNDSFEVYKKSSNINVEGYSFSVKDPFNRGEIRGGFGYVVFEDSSKNKLTTVNLADIEKSKAESKSNKFWGPYSEEMIYKTIVHKTMNKIEIDPSKINESFFKAENEEYEEPKELPKEKVLIDIVDENRKFDMVDGKVIEQRFNEKLKNQGEKIDCGF